MKFTMMFKRIIFLILISAVFFNEAALAVEGDKLYRVTATRLLVRAIPDRSGEVITSVGMNDRVWLVERSGIFSNINNLNAEWFHVKTSEGSTGYVFSAYLAALDNFNNYGMNEYLQGDLAADGSVHCSAELTWYPDTEIINGFPAYSIGDSWYFCCKSGIIRLREGRYRIISLPITGPRNENLINNRIDYDPGISGFARTGNDLWISTWHDGLFIYNIKDERFREIPGHIFNSVFIQRPFTSRFIWEGYFQHVASYDPEKGNWVYLDHIFSGLGQPSSHYKIFIEDDDVWINGPAHAWCTGGLVRFNPGDGKYSIYRRELPCVEKEPTRLDHMYFMSSPSYVFVCFNFVDDRNARYISSYSRKTGEWKAYSGATLYRVIDLMTSQVPEIRWENECFINSLERDLVDEYSPTSGMSYSLQQNEYARLVESVRNFYRKLEGHGIGREMKYYGLYENMVSGNAIYTTTGQWKSYKKQMLLDIKNSCPYTKLYGSVKNGIMVRLNGKPALLDPVTNNFRYFGEPGMPDVACGESVYIDSGRTRVYLRNPGMDEDQYYMLDTEKMTFSQISESQLPGGCNFVEIGKKAIYKNCNVTLQWNGMMVEVK